jgi:hypothetical protein
MGLKDIGKIVANQTAREAALESAPLPVSPGIRQWRESLGEKAKSIVPGTSKPADIAGHRGISYSGSNPTHQDLLKTLIENGHASKIVVHDTGAMSVPRDVAMKDEISRKFQTAADTSGGEKRYEGLTPKPSTAVTPAARKSEKDSKKPSVRPAAPRPTKPVSPVKAVASNIGSDPKSEIASLFVGGNARITPESIEMEKKKKADAEAADKAERARLRKERLAED